MCIVVAVHSNCKFTTRKQSGEIELPSSHDQKALRCNGDLLSRSEGIKHCPTGAHCDAVSIFIAFLVPGVWIQPEKKGGISI